MGEILNFPGRREIEEVVLFFDGACEPINPGGIATWGIAITRDGTLIHTNSGLACEPFSLLSTNNYAEYTALIKGLEYCLNHGIKSVVVKGDSMLVINQMTGKYAVRSKLLLPLFETALALSQKFSSVEYVWIPREENQIADSLSKGALATIAEKTSFGRMFFPFGKYKGKTVKEVLLVDPFYVKEFFRRGRGENRVLFSRWIEEILRLWL